MKLLYVTRSVSGGGAERVTSILANEHAAQGHQVHLVIFNSASSEYPIDPRVVTHRMPKGVIRRLRQLRQITREFLPDLIISLGSKYNYISASGMLRSNCVILSERNYPPLFYRNALSAAFAKYCYRRAAGVVFQTAEVERIYRSSLTGLSRLIPNPITDGLPPWRFNPDSKKIISFGRLEPQKNFSLLIEAFRILRDTNADYSLEIYGDGSQKAELSAQIERLDLGPGARLFPFDKSIHDKLSRSAFFVMSSEYEGMPNALLEAMSMGMPVISVDSKGGAARELFQDSSRGILVNRDAPAELAEAMTLLINSEATTRRIARAAAAIRDELSSGRIAEEWMEFYNAVKNNEPNKPLTE